MARLVELAGRHGKHHTTTIRELVEQGLDRPAQALAAAQGHPALALVLIDAQIVGRAKLREGLDSREIDAVEAAITQALDGADTNASVSLSRTLHSAHTNRRATPSSPRGMLWHLRAMRSRSKPQASLMPKILKASPSHKDPRRR
tara:strand:- start:35 stop:469 length:435 start_codon:yes stop_codon:yes gene_type:complete